ncbi:hypothetical protein PInf_027829 [Phytophthora infestans]|nr:hypothetical protein PInf_027829 [Phytophthora infestans]
MVEEDLEMHERQMSLLTVHELLDGDPIYKLTHEKLLQFKEFLFATKPKPPIAHEIAKLPPHKTTDATRRNFAQHGNSRFYVEEDTTIPNLLKDLPILSNEYADLVDLASKDTLSAQVMQMILHKLFGADPSILVIDPSNMGIANGALTTDIRYFKLALAGVTKKMKVLFSINCNNNHWCAVLMDLEKGRVYVYGSMASSYMIGVRAVSQKMIMMLPDGVRSSARLVTHDPGLGAGSFDLGAVVGTGWVSDGHNWVRVGAGLVS